MDPLKLVILFVSVMLAGAINAIAGGGTVISYPGFLFAGLPDITANASNAMALVPGSLGSNAAYRRDLAPNLKVLAILLVPTFLGALLGASRAAAQDAPLAPTAATRPSDERAPASAPAPAPVAASAPKDWLEGARPLDRAAFANQFYAGLNFYFLAHP